MLTVECGPCFFFCAAPQGAPNFIVDLCEERMMPDGSVSKSPDLSSVGLSRRDHGENHRHIGAIWDTQMGYRKNYAQVFRG
jgi:hypothetical protein